MAATESPCKFFQDDRRTDIIQSGSFETCAAMSISSLGMIAVIMDCPANSSCVRWITWDSWYVYAGATLPQDVAEASRLKPNISSFALRTWGIQPSMLHVNIMD